MGDHLSPGGLDSHPSRYADGVVKAPRRSGHHVGPRELGEASYQRAAVITPTLIVELSAPVPFAPHDT